MCPASVEEGLSPSLSFVPHAVPLCLGAQQDLSSQPARVLFHVPPQNRVTVQDVSCMLGLN